MNVANETGLKLLAAPQAGAEPTLLVVLKGAFALVPGGPCMRLPEEAQPELCGETAHMDALGRSPSWSTDFAPFKPYTDCFVLGRAYAPGGVPAETFLTGFKLGPMEKVLRVFGPRRWTRAGTPGSATPVRDVPLRWELSAGGLSDVRNPFGRGQDPEGDGQVALPQVESVSEPWAHCDERPFPVNLAPIPPWFIGRAGKEGTRDQKWALFRAPLPPEDYDSSMHNAAPFDQQGGNYPRGDEPLSLTNLHPKYPELETKLPGLRPRVAVVHADGRAEEVTMRLDTVVLQPDEDRIVLLWRGSVAIASPMPDAVALVHATLEELGAPAADAVAAAQARRAAAARPDPYEQAAQVEAATMADAKAQLAKLDLPPALQADIARQTRAEPLFDMLIQHVQAEIKRIRP